MITISKEIELAPGYDVGKIGPLNELVFFDIETTGFTPYTSNLYLIGVVYHQSGSWQLKQWFADSMAAEQELLTSFFQFITKYKTLVHFNGDSFDIPYLKKCAAQYGISPTFHQVQSFDIYRKARPLRRLLGLENLKQKSIETFLGLDRFDQFNGGQLIECYKEYLTTKDNKLYQFLLLHNEEDLKGMPQILTILDYLDILHSDWVMESHRLDGDSSHLFVNVTSQIQLPVPFQFACTQFQLYAERNTLHFSIPVYQAELKYFYGNYQNYYYLPQEDRAVHKRVAQYVDKGHRQQATAATCYIKRQGLFLPGIDCDDLFPIFRSDYHSKVYYHEYVDDTDFINTYLHQMLLAFC